MRNTSLQREAAVLCEYAAVSNVLTFRSFADRRELEVLLREARCVPLVAEAHLRDI